MKLLVAHEHPLMRDGLKAILERAGFELVAVAASGDETVTLALEHRPCVTIMSGALSEADSVATTRRLKAELPVNRIIALRDHERSQLGLDMLEAGATTCLQGSATTSELLGALRALDCCQGPPPKTASHLNAAPRFGERSSSERSRRLTQREREVLKLLAEGHSSKEIAQRLAVAVPTVETHRRQIVDKVGIRSVARLTKWAIRQGITTLD
jgi:DNA-binding NarL/FixJ family response regulator